VAKETPAARDLPILERGLEDDDFSFFGQGVRIELNFLNSGDGRSSCLSGIRLQLHRKSALGLVVHRDNDFGLRIWRPQKLLWRRWWKKPPTGIKRIST